VSNDIKKLEMGYTISEFSNTLQGQFIQNTSFSLKQINTTEWIVSIANISKTSSVKIKIAQAEPRKIAMLTLPVLDTRFAFENTSQIQQSDFMKIFFRYFHKGGG